MDMKSGILIAVTSLVVAFYFGFTFYQTIIHQDFNVISEPQENL